VVEARVTLARPHRRCGVDLVRGRRSPRSSTDAAVGVKP
jgi:hypothetical protein